MYVVWLHFLGPGQHLLIDVSITIVSTETQFWMMLAVLARVPGFAANRLGRTPSWMKTLDQPALFLSAMEVVID